MNTPKRILSWKDTELACLYIKYKLEENNFKPDYIVGLTRGGLIPAVMLSHLTGVKLVSLDASFRDSTDIPEHNLWLPEAATRENKKILIIDDINDSGKTFNWIRNDWNNCIGSVEVKWENVRFAALVHNESSNASTDYSFLTVNKTKNDVWIVFPWEQNE